MATSYLGVRLDALRQAQNADGGWGYFPRKQSWLEPTAYAALALAGEDAADRAWNLLQSWQAADGSFPPSREVDIASWGTSLCVTLASSRGELGETARKGVEWLVASSGVESNWINRAAARVGWLDIGRDASLRGWPWKPDTSSWVEPTAHALVALQKSASKFTGSALQERVRLGRAQLSAVRCADGGWNYGSPAALRIDLPSYPETTGLALVGLQRQEGLGKSIDLARRLLGETVSPLARAWLAIALEVHGAAATTTASSAAMPPDLQHVALEALASPEGNWRFLKTEAS